MVNSGRNLNKQMGPKYPLLHLYQVSLQLVHWFCRRFLKGFYQIWAWQPCDPDSLNKLSFHYVDGQTTEAKGGGGGGVGGVLECYSK